MGILDDIMAATGIGGATQAINPGGATQQQHCSALSMILDYVNSPQVGGISGLQRMFQEKGLGGIVSSWISTGQNLPISGDQLSNVLHSGALQQIAQKCGIDPGNLTSMMSTMLPHVVDKLTPNGQVPDNNSLQDLIASVRSMAAGGSR
jgi:uncharacterized protein YidB (DUF937 family)